MRLLHPLGRQLDRRVPARGAQIQGQATIHDLPFKPIVRPVLDRSYFNRKVMLEPGGQAILKVSYRVPDAAIVDGDSLVYRLDIDTQSTVVPMVYSVTLHLPEGYGLSAAGRLGDLDGRTLRSASGALDEARRFVVNLSKL